LKHQSVRRQIQASTQYRTQETGTGIPHTEHSNSKSTHVDKRKHKSSRLHESNELLYNKILVQKDDIENITIEGKVIQMNQQDATMIY